MKTLNYFLYIILACFVFSCQQLPEEGDGEWMPDEADRTLKVKVRSGSNAEIEYPLYLYAFSESGKLVASQTIENEKMDMSLPLSQGEFEVVAVSGTSEDYSLPDNPELDDVITLATTDGADTALMIGRAMVELEDVLEASTDIKMMYVVSALNVKLKDVPNNVTSVRLSLSPLYSSLSMGGEYGNEGDYQKVEVDCSLVSEGVWAAETSYIFPGSSKKTVFSICLKTDDGTEVTYGYTDNKVPEANYMFNVAGTYKGGVIVGGSFDVENWQGSIDVNFDFGGEMIPDDDDDNTDDKEDDGTEDDEDEGNDEQPDIKLEGVPEVGAIWNDMIVADMGEPDETGVDLLLMSMDEWKYIYADEADEVPKGYSINGISGWRYPTHEEAALLRNRFCGDRLRELNELIDEYNEENNLDGDDALWGLANGDDERYLCLKDGVFYTYRFVAGTPRSKAGVDRTYYVRLVKSYRHVSE